MLIWAAFALCLYVGSAMWLHPDQPPPGWHLGSVPPVERMRALGAAVLVSSGLLGLFGIWATWSMIQYYTSGWPS